MMTLVEFAERTSEISFSSFQKRFLAEFENAKNNGYELFVSFPRMPGRKMILDIIREFEKLK